MLRPLANGEVRPAHNVSGVGLDKAPNQILAVTWLDMLIDESAHVDMQYILTRAASVV
jgi:hypothetical protein